MGGGREGLEEGALAAHDGDDIAAGTAALLMGSRHLGGGDTFLEHGEGAGIEPERAHRPVQPKQIAWWNCGDIRHSTTDNRDDFSTFDFHISTPQPLNTMHVSGTTRIPWQAAMQMP